MNFTVFRNICWLNRNTNAIKDAAAILYYEDFVGYILTGQRKVSYSSAARSMAFDIRKFWNGLKTF